MATTLKEIFSREQVQARTRELGQELAALYAGRPLLAVCVLKGGFIFFADLIRAFDFTPLIDFVRVASYGQGSESTGSIRLTKDIEMDIRGKDVLLVDDIADSGLSLQFLCQALRQREPASLKTCVLVDKLERRQVDFTPDYVGFRLERGFLVGCGMDYAEQHRQLESICEVVFPDEQGETTR